MPTESLKHVLYLLHVLRVHHRAGRLGNPVPVKAAAPQGQPAPGSGRAGGSARRPR